MMPVNRRHKVIPFAFGLHVRKPGGAINEPKFWRKKFDCKDSLIV